MKDRTFHNSTAHSAPLISVDLADVTLVDDSEWAPFVDAVPAHVLVYLDKIQFAIAPWWNVTEPDELVDPATLASLFDFKKGLYGGFAATHALGVRLGSAEPTVQSTVEDVPPSMYWHWEIPAANLAGLETQLNLPAGLSLAPSRLQDSDASAAHWLTLHVYRESGPMPGLRAEWSTHVDDDEGIRALTIEARADHPALDPTNIPSATDPYTPRLRSPTRLREGRWTRWWARVRRRSLRPLLRLPVVEPRSCRPVSGSAPTTFATGRTGWPTDSSTTARPSTPRSRSTRERSR